MEHRSRIYSVVHLQNAHKTIPHRNLQVQVQALFIYRAQYRLVTDQSAVQELQ